jgi:IS30 family transposase
VSALDWIRKQAKITTREAAKSLGADITTLEREHKRMKPKDTYKAKAAARIKGLSRLEVALDRAQASRSEADRAAAIKLAKGLNDPIADVLVIRLGGE